MHISSAVASICDFSLAPLVTSMDALPPLSMSQSKDDLLKHLNISPETYSLMAKETDIVYKWLTSEKSHLKENCKQNPPYDWSDIKEKSKDEAIASIAQSKNLQTQCVWSLAAPTPDCPNWIARWFLYHKFRYREGRNRNPAKSSGTGKHHYSYGHGDSSKQHHYKHQSEEHEDYYEHEPHYLKESMTSAPVSQGYYARGAVATGYTYPVAHDADQETADEKTVYYDPVRDMTR